jgi:hypothetical protein
MRRIVAVAVVLLLLLGCQHRNPRGAVGGTITYKGQPINSGALLLYPAGGKGDPLLVPVGEDGTFRTSDLPPGNYKVVVEGNSGQSGGSGAQYAAKPTIPFPKKYKDVQTTDLTMSIGTSQQTVNLELKD